MKRISLVAVILGLFLSPTVDAWADGTANTVTSCIGGYAYDANTRVTDGTTAETPANGVDITCKLNVTTSGAVWTVPASVANSASFAFDTAAFTSIGAGATDIVSQPLGVGAHTFTLRSGNYASTSSYRWTGNAAPLTPTASPSPSPSPSPLPSPSPSPSPAAAPSPTPAYSPPTEPEPSYDPSQGFNPMGHFDRGDTGNWTDIGPWFASVIFAVVLIPFAWLTLVGAIRRFVNV